MTPRSVHQSRLGHYLENSLSGEPARAFIPRLLPPDPAIDLPRILREIEAANRELGRLDGISTLLPNTSLFVWMYVRKEALLSSQIEGTQSTLADLLLFENGEIPTAPMDDVVEVSNYVTAMRHGLDRLKAGFPLSLRLIREMHEKLMASGRGADKRAGEFRTTQNWIGGTRPGNAIFVPPPPDLVPELLSNLEKFLHDRETYPVLLRAALAHVQFETIHPFLDGNGRLGRLLITLLLCEEDALRLPTLYLSLYLKAHRQRYYDLLQSVRETGDWESWLAFFLEGVAATSRQGFDTAQKLLALMAEDEKKISSLGRPAATALRVHADLKRNPVVSVPVIVKRLAISQPATQTALDNLQQLGIIKEITGKKRGRLYSYGRYLDILDEGTEPLPR